MINTSEINVFGVFSFMNKFEQIIEQKFATLNKTMVLEGEIQDKIQSIRNTINTAIPGGTPDDRWESTVDANNLYYLDPRGNSSTVIDAFKKKLKEESNIVVEALSLARPVGSASQSLVTQPPPATTAQPTQASVPEPNQEEDNAAWAKARALLLIKQREHNHPCTLREMSSGEPDKRDEEDREADAKELMIQAGNATTQNVDDAFTKLQPNEKVAYLKQGDELAKKKQTTPTNTTETHNLMKTWFKGAGVYCSGKDAYDKMSQGRLDAAVGLAKGALDLVGTSGDVYSR